VRPPEGGEGGTTPSPPSRSEEGRCRGFGRPAPAMAAQVAQCARSERAGEHFGILNDLRESVPLQSERSDG
jgi:hypothetical protein